MVTGSPPSGSPRRPRIPRACILPLRRGRALADSAPGPARPRRTGQSDDHQCVLLATVRVLPFDSEVPARFIALWNATHDPAQAWNFVYNQILYVYDMLFSVMLQYVNLGDRAAVEAAAGPISGLDFESRQRGESVRNADHPGYVRWQAHGDLYSGAGSSRTSTRQQI